MSFGRRTVLSLGSTEHFEHGMNGPLSCVMRCTYGEVDPVEPIPAIPYGGSGDIKVIRAVAVRQVLGELDLWDTPDVSPDAQTFWPKIYVKHVTPIELIEKRVKSLINTSDTTVMGADFTTATFLDGMDISAAREVVDYYAKNNARARYFSHVIPAVIELVESPAFQHPIEAAS